MIINKIRERAGLAVGIVALALGLFIVGSDLLGPNSRLFGSDRSVGEIDGDKIDYEQLDAEIERVKRIYFLNTGKQPDENDMQMVRRQAWSQLIFKIAYHKEFEKLGLQVSDAELVDMVQGNNIHPAIRMMFGDKEGNFDVNQVKNFLKNLDKVEPRYQEIYRSLEEGIPIERLRNKYENLLTQTYYITEYEARKEYENANTMADIKYLYIPYNTVPDSLLDLSENKMKEYFNKNKKSYKLQTNRHLQYVTFPIQATAEDEQKIFKATQELIEDFAATDADTAFVEAKSDATGNHFLSANRSGLPSELNDVELVKGKVYGPFREGNSFKLYKVVNEMEDSVYSIRARHILLKANNNTEASKAEAKKKANEILAKIKAGASFAEMASQYGTDGTASRGGDLGWFSEGTMVQKFNDAVFSSPKGLINKIIETEFGYHIVEVTANKTKKKYVVAVLQKDITPSDETREAVYRRAGKFANFKSRQEFINAVKADSTLVLEEDRNVTKDDRNLDGVFTNKVRELIRWAYNEDTEIDDVSEIYDLDNMFIIGTLVNATEEGEASFEDVKERVRPDFIKEQQKQYILNKLSSLKGSLEEIAQAYDPSKAFVYSSPTTTFNTTSLLGVGLANESIGAAFALKEGQISKPIPDKYGVLIVQLNKLTPASEIADYSSQKASLSSKYNMNTQSRIASAIEKHYQIKDWLHRYF
ncbi:MAG: peptidylprolyl isomerase [Cytophagales bacterium]|nr:peptidylprolyl isomerase [Cytophagales bacterium]MDW8384435.1 peptidylprolyl isomerase [Flammeovirgaceae bacterium]